MGEPGEQGFCHHVSLLHGFNIRDTPLPDRSPTAKKPGKIPRYLQLTGELREDVLAGKYGPENPFPTENQLCRHFDVSRFTVREALRRLQNEGLIARKRGSGTVVQPAAARGGALHQPLSNMGEILQYARDTTVAFEPLGSAPLPPLLAEQIGHNTSGHWSSFRGIRKAEGRLRPIAVTEAFFHEKLADAVSKLDPAHGSLFSQIERITGICVGKVTQDIQAVAADPQTARDLLIEEGDPVLRILRCYLSPQNEVFEISVSLHPGDRFVYSMHIDVDA